MQIAVRDTSLRLILLRGTMIIPVPSVLFYSEWKIATVFWINKIETFGQSNFCRLEITRALHDDKACSS